MRTVVRKEVGTYVETEVDVEIETDDIDDDELLQAVMERFTPEELAMKLDEEASSWEFTAKMRDYFVAEMAKVEVVK